MGHGTCRPVSSPAALCFLECAIPWGYSGGKGREQVYRYRPNPVVGLHVPAGHDVLISLKPLLQTPSVVSRKEEAAAEVARAREELKRALTTLNTEPAS